MKTLAFVFPGQGSQKIGMGKALFEAFAEARDVFALVDDSLNQKLSTMMFEGTEDELNLTENTQPALMAVSMAVARVLEKQGNFRLSDRAKFVAGHSLGEYSALVAAGALGVAKAAELLRLRGASMQDAVPVGKGAMAVLLGVDFAQAREICQKAVAALGNPKENICVPANDNAPGQVVISGSATAVARALEEAKAFGVRRAMILPVSVPSHSPLMGRAADAMHQALCQTTINVPAMPVVVNVTARPESDPAQLRRCLVDQMTGTVRWRESIEHMATQGIDTIVEIGAGKVLSGLVKRIDEKMATMSLETPQDIESFLTTGVKTAA